MNDLLHFVKDDSHGPSSGGGFRDQQDLAYGGSGQYGSGSAGPSSGAYDSYSRPDSPPGAAEVPGQDKSMADFFAKTEELQSSMNQIRAKQQELWKMHEQSKSIVRRNEITAHREQMQVRSTVQCCAVCHLHRIQRHAGAAAAAAAAATADVAKLCRLVCDATVAVADCQPPPAAGSAACVWSVSNISHSTKNVSPQPTAMSSHCPLYYSCSERCC
jgi:hypothetical protein